MAKQKNHRLFSTVVSIFLQGLPEVDLTEFLRKHPESMDLIVAATRQNGFTAQVLEEFAPTNIRNIKRVEEIPDALRLLEFCRQISNRYHFTPLEMQKSKRVFKTKKPKTPRNLKSPDAGSAAPKSFEEILATCRAGSVAYYVVNKLKTSDAAKAMLASEGSAANMAATLSKQLKINIVDTNLNFVLKHKFNFTPRDVFRKKE